MKYLNKAIGLIFKGPSFKGLSLVGLSVVALSLMTCQPLLATEYYVALDGNDKNKGTIDKPFAHLQRAVNKMRAGDTVFIRAGQYLESIKLNKLKGTPAKPYTISAYADEKVVFNGSIKINRKWEKHQGNIYKTILTQPIWQLFVNGKSMSSARWPNGNWLDGSIWDKRQSMAWPQLGTLGTYYNKQLRALDVDLTGAIIVVNSGSFKSYQSIITKHKAGDEHFSYRTKGVKSHFSFKDKVSHHGYFVEGKLGLLDSENEWFLDPKNNELYLWAKGGVNPATLDIRGKIQSYALTILRSKHIKVRGIDFFGTTFNVDKSSHVSIEDTTLRYPSYSKRMLGDLSRIDVTRMVVKKEFDPAFNTLRNCTIAYTDGPAIEMKGLGNTIENCNMHDIDYSCTYKGGYTLNMVNAPELTFRRNTVHTTGCSELFKAGVRNLIELNDLSHSGYLQNDGSMIQLSVKQQSGGVVRHNWVHDSVKQGIRFDNMNLPNSPFGSNGQVSNNVVWNTDRIFFKGDKHFIFNNLSFDNKRNDLIISSNTAIQGHNHSTITRNNVSNKMSGHRIKSGAAHPVPGINDHNWHGVKEGLDVRSQLRDPDNLDFRPKSGSSLVDGGAPIAGKSLPFIGKAPDIGPYEFGAKDYWIPGFKAASASVPVPRYGATHVKFNADLMWLNGYRARSHDVYIGEERAKVASANKKSLLYQGNYIHNIVSPRTLMAGKTYFWRVDVLQQSKIIKDKVTKGKVWSFTVEAAD